MQCPLSGQPGDNNDRQLVHYHFRSLSAAKACEVCVQTSYNCHLLRDGDAVDGHAAVTRLSTRQACVTAAVTRLAETAGATVDRRHRQLLPPVASLVQQMGIVERV